MYGHHYASSHSDFGGFVFFFIIFIFIALIAASMKSTREQKERETEQQRIYNLPESVAARKAAAEKEERKRREKLATEVAQRAWYANEQHKKERDSIPLALRGVPGIMEMDNDCGCGIYILTDHNDKPVYVGQTIRRAAHRIEEHRKDGRKFHRAYFRSVDESRLNHWETSLIRRLRNEGHDLQNATGGGGQKRY